MTLMFLNGTAMSGQKDHGSHAGSTFLGPARTAARYRFFAVRDEFPGLYPVKTGGRVIDGELYDIPEDVLRGRLLPSEPPELELGEIELAGRGTADEVWAMVAAQTLGARVRLRIHTDPELSARGAAMLAAACTGVPLAEATTSLGDEVLVVTPTAADLVAADRAAARYLAASDVALDWLDREIGRVAAGGPR